MLSASGDSRSTSGSGGVPASEQIQLVPSPSPAQKTDSTVSTTSPGQEETSFFQQSRSNEQLTALDSLFSQESTRQARPKQQAGNNNAPDPQALAGGGARIGGVSTPNAGGGGSGGGSGGPGPAVTNANQYLSAYLGMAGSALTPGATPAVPTPAAAAPPPTASASPPSGNNDAPLTPGVTPAQAGATAPTNNYAAPAQQPAGQTSGGDPLYVLDMNTGETIPANVTLNSFSTWSEDLLAQVSGAAVSSYSWNTSKAPDLTNISGQTSANLQGTWTTFTGAARTDTITVTETPQSGTPLSQTMTFLVAGTNSPGYSSSRPTSSATWPSVVTPDQLTAAQATQPGGPYASLGLADGSVQTSFAMPSYNPNVAPVSLDYSSTAANAQPIFLAYYQLPTGQAVPSTITAQLTLNGTAGSSIVYNTSGLNPGDWMQIPLQGNATSLSTGRYPWQITVTNGSNNTNYSGDVDIVNQASSPYGAGWSLDNVEQLVPVSGSGVILVQPGGTSLWFANGQQSGTFVTPAGDFSTLVQNQNGTYTQTLTDGTEINFNSTGQETSTVDRDGNTTTFGYTNGLLTTITDMNGQQTTLGYNGSGQLTSITDPANRTATLAYSGNQLTSITDPANDVWGYVYDSSNDLTTLTDPNNHATTFTYNFADRVSGVTQANNTTEQLTAEQMNGLAAPGTGTSGNPATALLLATGDQAKYTDPNDQVWTTGLDWLGFGLDTLDADPLGDTSLTYRNANGLPWLSADALGRATRDFFNSQGDPTEIVNPDGSYSQYSYNGFSEVTRYTDPTGSITTYTYNNKGDLTQETNALGYNTTFAYNTAGLVTSTTDPLGNVTTYGYNSLNELTGTTNALNQTTTCAYTNAGQVSSATDAMGYTSTYAYDALNRMTSETLPDTSTTSSTTTFAYDDVGNMISETDPLGNVTTYSYNAVNEMTAETNALNQTTTFGYDGNGNQTSATNPLNQTTTNTYNAADELVGVTNALGYTITYGYDAAREMISQTNPLNQTTTYGYTLLGQLYSTTNPLGDLTTYGYNGAGDNTSIDQSGVIATMTYNAVHELVSSSDVLGNVTTNSYDADGNLIGVTDPLDHTTTYTYNAINELVGVTNALDKTTTYTYNADGDQTSITNPLGDVTSYTFDAQGRQLTQTAPNGGVTTYTYDLDGNQTSITDPDNNTTSYSYNAVNELVSTTNPLGYQTTNAYNAAGLLTSTTDADGRTIDYAYNAVGAETSETWVGGNYTATFQYNAAGELTSASDPYSTYTYTYNAAGQETSVSNAGTPGVPTVTLSYGYDAYGARTSLTDSVGGSVSYGYDADQRLASLQLSTGSRSMTLDAKVTFGYDAASRLTGVTRTGVSGSHTITSSLGYDSADRLTNIAHKDATASTTLANYTYGYNAGGELTSYQDNSGNSLTYGYDNNGELTSATGTLNGSSYGVSYSYDLNGNRNMSGYTTGTGNELTSDGTYSYTYDKDGNTLTQTDIATGSVTYYTWDYENRLTEEKVENSQGQVLEDEKFTYDVNDNRIGVSLNGTQQLYTVYDGSNPYIDFNGSGTLTERYLTNPDSLSQFYGQVSASGATQWFLTDNLNSIRQVVSTSGTSLDAITYDPYGNIVSQTNANNAPRLLYAGGASDALTGNYQFGVRPYSPADGRFPTQDWEGFAAGNANLYGYVFNAPTYLTDPSGLQPGLNLQSGLSNAQQNALVSLAYSKSAPTYQRNIAVSVVYSLFHPPGTGGVDSGAIGGAVEGVSVGAGVGMTVGMIAGPPGMIAGGLIGAYLGGKVGYQQGMGKGDFLAGAGAAATPTTIMEGVKGGITGVSMVCTGQGILIISSGIKSVALVGGGSIIAADGAIVVQGTLTTTAGAGGLVVMNMAGQPPEGGNGQGNGGQPNPASMPYGGPQNALKLREMMRQALQEARDMGENQLAGQIASLLEKMEMGMLKAYPGLF